MDSLKEITIFDSNTKSKDELKTYLQAQDTLLIQKSPYRWLILVLACLSTFGVYYCNDNSAATHDHLEDQLQLGSKFSYYYSLLYSSYSFVNMIMPVLGGTLIYFCGLRRMYISFSLIIILGQLTFALGSSYNSIIVMIVGRVISSLGAENLNVCQASLICLWFYKKEQALPLGLNVTISRFGSVLNDIISPRIALSNNATPAYWTGLGFALMSFASTCLLCYVDYKRRKLQVLNDDNSDSNNNNDKEEPESSSHYNWKSLSRSLCQFTQLFWLLCILCFLFYGSILPFNYITVAYLTTTYFTNMNEDEARTTAGLYMSIPFIIGAIIIPCFGFLIDKFGKRSYLSLISGIMISISFGLLLLIPPLCPLILIGVTYSLFAGVIWPAISLVVEKRLLGLGYGLTTCFQNAGMAINPLIVAAIHTKTNDYNYTIIYFISLGGAAILISIWIIVVNLKNNRLLDLVEFNDENGKESELEQKEANV